MNDRASRFGIALEQSLRPPTPDPDSQRQVELERKLDSAIDEITEIKTVLLHLTSNLDIVSQKLSDIDRKCDHLTEKFDGEVLKECKKMGSHIDFVETVYDNVKHPLTFICNKVKHLSVGETPVEPTYQIAGPDDSDEDSDSNMVD